MERKEFVCKNCQFYFETLQDCLRHDLIQHICCEKKGKSTQPRKICDEEEENQRLEVHDAFEKSESGQELHELFKLYCIDRDTKEKLFKIVRSCLLEDLEQLKDLEIKPFGSISNGLMMKNSDIDIFARTRGTPNTGIYYHIIELLRRGKYFNDINPIRHARVPIIKCRHINTGFKIDINCTCPDSVENTRLIRQVLCYDIRLRTLMRFIKIWARHHQLVGQGLMTCYCLTALVLFYLQQKALIPSIEKMQSEEPPMLIANINYAFNIYKHMKPLPVDLHTRDLLRDFYLYYQKFEFHRLMVATHIGYPVPLADLKTGKFYNSSYERQLTILKTTGEEVKAKPLSVDCEMVVQDLFQLNQNVAKSVTQSHFNYFRHCIESASRICTKIPKQRDSDLYEALLFDLFGNGMLQSKRVKYTPTGPIINRPITLVCNPTSDSAEVKAMGGCLLSASDDKLVIPLQLCALESVQLIWTVFKEIYCLDVNIVCGNAIENVQFDCTKAIKTTMSMLEENSTCLWLLTGSIDMWTGRKYRCISTEAFVGCQHLHIKKLMAKRSKMPEFAIEFDAYLNILSSNNCKTLELIFNHRDQTAIGDERKFAYQKFYNNFKWIIQSTKSKHNSNSDSNDER